MASAHTGWQIQVRPTPVVHQSAHHVLRNTDDDGIVTLAFALRRRHKAVGRDDVGPLFWRHPHPNSLAERIRAWPQCAGGSGADDCDLGFGARFVRMERAPAIDRYLKRREILR